MLQSAVIVIIPMGRAKIIAIMRLVPHREQLWIQLGLILVSNNNKDSKLLKLLVVTLISKAKIEQTNQWREVVVSSSNNNNNYLNLYIQ